MCVFSGHSPATGERSMLHCRITSSNKPATIPKVTHWDQAPLPNTMPCGHRHWQSQAITRYPGWRSSRLQDEALSAAFPFHMAARHASEQNKLGSGTEPSSDMGPTRKRKGPQGGQQWPSGPGESSSNEPQIERQDPGSPPDIF